MRLLARAVTAMGSLGVVALGFAAACGRIGFAAREDGTEDPDAGVDGRVNLDAAEEGGDDAPACATPAEQQFADEGTMHQDGGVIDWSSNPPTSGTHYPEWARWNVVYDTPIPRGYWVHNLEHGGTVYTYNCPGGCADEVARLTAMLAALPLDTECPPLVHRALVTPDPDLPAGVRFAASAWTYSITSDCLDEAAFTAFYNEHYNLAPEFQCTDGSYPVGARR